MVCNRDERRSRASAHPPVLRCTGSMTMVWPVDPFGGGTWIGANDAGLVMVLLNRTPRIHGTCPERSRWPCAEPTGTATRPQRRSRGVIIPSLLELSRLASVVNRAKDLPAAEFEPFTLVVVQASTVAVIRNMRHRIAARVRILARPLIFTSSSLGDDVVRAPRRALFARLLERHGSALQAQARFHRHQWRDRPEISVSMSRPDAATVSRTLVDVDVVRASVEVRYTPIPN